MMKQLSQNISSTCRADNVDIKYTTTTTTTTIYELVKIDMSSYISHSFSSLDFCKRV